MIKLAPLRAFERLLNSWDAASDARLWLDIEGELFLGILHYASGRYREALVLRDS